MERWLQFRTVAALWRTRVFGANSGVKKMEPLTTWSSGTKFSGEKGVRRGYLLITIGSARSGTVRLSKVSPPVTGSLLSTDF